MNDPATIDLLTEIISDVETSEFRGDVRGVVPPTRNSPDRAKGLMSLSCALYACVLGKHRSTADWGRYCVNPDDLRAPLLPLLLERTVGDPIQGSSCASL